MAVAIAMVALVRSGARVPGHLPNRYSDHGNSDYLEPA